jgi:hypothetical protein
MIETVGDVSVDCGVISQLLIIHIFHEILEKSEIITTTENTIYFQILREAVQSTFSLLTNCDNHTHSM